MDGQRFDDLVKRLCSRRLSRVNMLRGLAAGAMAAATGAKVGADQVATGQVTQEAPPCRGAGSNCEGGGQTCCAGLVCNGGENPTKCRPCGAEGQLCCPGFTCPAPLICVGNACVQQGAGGGGGAGGGVAVRCTSNADCPGGFCNTTTGQCFVIQGLNCRSGETPAQCCNRSVKKGCKRKQQTAHARENCLRKGKKRCRSLLAGIG